MRNPKWHRDEIILALDLYFDSNRGTIEARNPNIIRLSEILNQLPIFSNKPDRERFRNPNGVGLKLSNFLAIDPSYQGKGMNAYSKLDKEVFDEFFNDRQKLINIASEIKNIIKDDNLRQSLYKIEDDENTETDEVKEGQVLYKLHKHRERNKQIVVSKKKSVWNATGKLACEVCGFDFYQTYGDLGWDFIECHHKKPLSEYQAGDKTKIEDLAVVCANCHRMLHRKIGVLTVEQLKKKIKIYQSPHSGGKL
ncbi:HNH endonuclease [Crocinitomicaceae bacterium CZZ-1]|uniref:HNH endonuclease n=1 Tax=Taishania pollutisoli TaxID=2766479 RepID=A0A8J6PKN7_9FLAO|nr:HNH endonuclease [Taishania pollutisoli]MBC9813364.1 HNH endonuclease [Taishania pollutisoli]